MKGDTVSLETVCTCKVCNHGRAVDCLKDKCQCCSKTSHSMVMDGIEGFAPKMGS
jgi:hypothetical protein